MALVGPSGGGKTTVAGLISRFWDVTGGAIQIGGVNVKDIPKDILMDTVAYVFQDSKLLKTSILENVRLAKPNASRQEVERVLHGAKQDDDLKHYYWAGQIISVVGSALCVAVYIIFPTPFASCLERMGRLLLLQKPIYGNTAGGL